MARPPIVVPHPHVRCDPAKFAGSPYVVGSGVLVRRLWAWYRGGASVRTLMRRYPKLGAGKIFDALAFACDNPAVLEDDLERERALVAQEKVLNVGLRPMAQQPLPFPSDELLN